MPMRCRRSAASCGRDVAAAAGIGELVVSGHRDLDPSHTLDLVDPESGANKSVDVEWRNALEIQVRQKRARPFGYLLPAAEIEAATRFVAPGRHGVAALRGRGQSMSSATAITRARGNKKEDVRRNDEDSASNVVQIATAAEPARVTARRATTTCRSDQPLANVIAAALEPGDAKQLRRQSHPDVAQACGRRTCLSAALSRARTDQDRRHGPGSRLSVGVLRFRGARRRRPRVESDSFKCSLSQCTRSRRNERTSRGQRPPSSPRPARDRAGNGDRDGARGCAESAQTRT